MKLQINDLQNFKVKQEKISCLTAYDYKTAQILDEAGIDLILVGDSLANVFMGLDSTTKIGMKEMIHHTKAVAKGVSRAILISDLPFASYQIALEEALYNSVKLIQCGADGVKLEGASDFKLEIIKRLKDIGIPCIGHLGYTPQSSLLLGMGRIQGKTEESAEKIFHEAKALEKAGVEAVVLELIPSELAQKITEHLKIPTIGIGAGIYCDGQVLVSDDMLGKSPKVFNFVKKYADLNTIMKDAFINYIKDVKAQ